MKKPPEYLKSSTPQELSIQLGGPKPIANCKPWSWIWRFWFSSKLKNQTDALHISLYGLYCSGNQWVLWKPVKLMMLHDNTFEILGIWKETNLLCDFSNLHWSLWDALCQILLLLASLLWVVSHLSFQTPTMMTQTQSQLYTQLMSPYYCLSTSYMLSGALWNKNICKVDTLQQWKCIVLRLLRSSQEARHLFSLPEPWKHSIIILLLSDTWCVETFSYHMMS